MNQALIHVYLMPGMAASPLIFEYIKLPEDQFKIHYLEWVLPNPKENLQDYAYRMSKKVMHDQAVLIGVSFGGVLVQEMSKHISVRKLFVVSRDIISQFGLKYFLHIFFEELAKQKSGIFSTDESPKIDFEQFESQDKTLHLSIYD